MLQLASNVHLKLTTDEVGGITFIFYSHYSRYSGIMKPTTIQVDAETRDMLKSFGRKGETYNDIIQKLIKIAKYIDFMEENYHILDTEENWVNLDEL